MWWQYVTSFFSNSFVDVVIGAVIGGVLSYKGAMNSTSKNIKALYDQEKRVRDVEKNKLQKVVKMSLLSETKQNLKILEGGYRVVFAEMSLVDDMWSLHKGQIDFLPLATQESLIMLHASISRYNSLVDTEKAFISANHGGTSELVPKIQELAGEIIVELKVTIGFLEETNRELGKPIHKS